MTPSDPCTRFCPKRDSQCVSMDLQSYKGSFSAFLCGCVSFRHVVTRASVCISGHGPLQKFFMRQMIWLFVFVSEFFKKKDCTFIDKMNKKTSLSSSSSSCLKRIFWVPDFYPICPSDTFRWESRFSYLLVPSQSVAPSWPVSWPRKPGPGLVWCKWSLSSQRPKVTCPVNTWHLNHRRSEPGLESSSHTRRTRRIILEFTGNLYADDLLRFYPHSFCSVSWPFRVQVKCSGFHALQRTRAWLASFISPQDFLSYCC